MSRINGDPPERFEHPELIDTHCHLDDEVYAADLDSVIEDSRARGVTRWINVGFEPDRWQSTVALSNQVRGMSHMLGLHPGYAGQWAPEVRVRLESLVTTSRTVAIGEIGLDFFRRETNARAQRSAFNEQLDLAVEMNQPAVIHMRAAEDEVLDLLKERRTLPQLVFHSFEGTMRLRDFAVEHGSTVGFGGLATRTSAADLRLVLRTIPLDQIVLETDSPYLVPSGARRKRNAPANVAVIATFLARLHGTTIAEVAEKTTRNAERTFSLMAH